MISLILIILEAIALAVSIDSGNVSTTLPKRVLTYWTFIVFLTLSNLALLGVIPSFT